MKDPQEGFLRRWSRRKALHGADADALREGPAPSDALAEPAPPEPAPDGAAPPELPPVETLTAESDFTVFLRAEVPRALRHAALRKAWTSNPAIADHKPLVDYDWDLNAPGYGKLWDVDDGKKLASALLQHLEEGRASAPEPQSPAPEPDRPKSDPAQLEQAAPGEEPEDPPDNSQAIA